MNKFDDLYFKKAAWLCEASEDDDDEDKVEEDETETDDTAEDADVEAVEEIECPDCDGTGEDEDGEECETCGGTGVIAPEESEEDIVADAEDAISDAEDDDDDAEADPDVEPDPDEEYELDLADPVCPCCGAHLNVISDTESDAEETATEEDVPTTEVDGFEVADPSIMGPETNIYYSDEDTEPVEYSEDGEDDDDDDDDVDESTQVNEAKKILKNVGMSREDKIEFQFYLEDKIENMALEYLSEVGDDFDSMLYSQIESSITAGDMIDDFNYEFKDGNYPKGKKLKEWITDWVNAQIDNCIDNYDTDEE